MFRFIVPSTLAPSAMVILLFAPLLPFKSFFRVVPAPLNVISPEPVVVRLLTVLAPLMVTAPAAVRLSTVLAPLMVTAPAVLLVFSVVICAFLSTVTATFPVAAVLTVVIVPPFMVVV